MLVGINGFWVDLKGLSTITISICCFSFYQRYIVVYREKGDSNNSFEQVSFNIPNTTCISSKTIGRPKGNAQIGQTVL